jgi:hypothetical protein
MQSFLIINFFEVVYTEMTSKVGILTRRHPEFESGLPMPKQLNLNKLSDAGRLKVRGCRRSQKPIFEVVLVYRKSTETNF